ncbi:Pyroglutamyl-peptidase 1 [Apiospora phragmitis]|uniref:Pyroglutamyl-peptidase 1 n=1 Tax=Apiospora phragmitis TaxID=2905665 RepID=A0ABR1TSA8_9PEZI
MGSVGVPKDDEFTILVTGFGPVKDYYPLNPSWEIAQSLPEYLPFDRVKDPAHKSPTGGNAASALPPRVRILVPPAPIRVNYEVVRGVVPVLWDDPGCKIDAALHNGMAGPQHMYQVERRAHREGYLIKDVDGQFLEDDRRRREAGGDAGWIWEGLPLELLSDLDVNDIHKRWVQRCPKGLDLRISEDPGRYLCDFIYYSSMAHLTKQNRPRKVLFLHVPCEQSQETIKSGCEIAT